jgi:hypothetical protein
VAPEADVRLAVTPEEHHAACAQERGELHAGGAIVGAAALARPLQHAAQESAAQRAPGDQAQASFPSLVSAAPERIRDSPDPIAAAIRHDRGSVFRHRHSHRPAPDCTSRVQWPPPRSRPPLGMSDSTLSGGSEWHTRRSRAPGHGGPPRCLSVYFCGYNRRAIGCGAWSASDANRQDTAGSLDFDQWTGRGTPSN